MKPITAAVLAGVSTGGRSFTALAALALATRDPSARQPDRTLSRPWAKLTLVAAAAGELVGDKLPTTPSRLAPPILAGRVLNAAACGAIIARRVPRAPDVGDPQAPLPVPVSAAGTTGLVAVLAAPAMAVISSALGARWRALAAGIFRTDLVGALLEDAAAIALATGAARF